MAERILDRSYPILKLRMDGWLGNGLYFWQDAPHRALWWAKHNVRLCEGTHSERGPQRPAVPRAVIDLRGALDFLDSSPENETLLRHADNLEFANSTLPMRKRGERHMLDCMVINLAVEYRLNVVGIAQVPFARTKVLLGPRSPSPPSFS